MLYCPGKGQELLSTLGVNLECHASSVFLVLKPPLSIIDALCMFFKFHKIYIDINHQNTKNCYHQWWQCHTMVQWRQQKHMGKQCKNR